MKKKNFFTESAKKIWDGFLGNIGVGLCGGFLIFLWELLKRIENVRKFINNIPTERVLTPFVLVLVITIVLIIALRKQKRHIINLERKLLNEDEEPTMVTHCGVWWKIYPSSEYIEDFPYCTCCEPSKKLKQTEWFQDEVYQCPETKNDFKLFDDIPRKREEILSGLYNTYFKSLGLQVERAFFAEHHRIKELNTGISEKDLFDKLFSIPPFNRIPKEDLEEIRKKNSNPISAFHFIERHFSQYKQFFRYPIEDDKKT